ncbi:MAG: glycoside hydrolase family 43 protein [Burkholderiales bacterium]|nr:glycoside hydrolase family 43 protein [Phycisphaerae bacterium]
MISNPVLPGFHPDPSILRVGDDYYIATSTFEWFPGVPIHHSRDLVNWRLIGHALTTTEHLDLKGVPNSAGIWAPSLSYADGKFHLLYTIVRTYMGGFKDLANYLVTADSIAGPWSERIFLNATGFDGSLFHDDDGRKWVVNMRWDHRKGRPRFAGIELQEYSASERKLIGPIRNILRKPQLIEGPNLYKKDGWYYLMLAEGGTGWNHGISMARSRTIEGPYECDPLPLLMTSRHDGTLPLQKAGHGELVQTQAGEWYLVHLCARPVFPERRCTLGRETAIQKVEWNQDGWLRLANGTTDAAVEVPPPADLPPHPWPAAAGMDDFDDPQLRPQWQTLRVPAEPSWMSLSERPGWLRLRGRESLISLFDQSLVARRLQAFDCQFETRMEFAPVDFGQSAGLVCFYDTRMHFYLRVTHDDQRGRVLGVVLVDDGNYDELSGSEIDVNDWPAFYLRAVIRYDQLQFSAAPDGKAWRNIGPVLDASKLSDDYGQGLHFTGAFVGVCCQDLVGTRLHADFDYLRVTTGEGGR